MSAPLKGWLRRNLYVVFDGSVIEVFHTDYALGDSSGPRSASARRALDFIADVTLDGGRLWWAPVQEPGSRQLLADSVHPDCLPFAEALVAAVRQAKARP
ncbi:MAG: hypothetical protein KIT84_06380 [Labilithrix sp.]|nr:hypothetical protein [Labilithrix sp.]MCW5810619.1 hypothetical protein [Labilithrix sp.]